MGAYGAAASGTTTLNCLLALNSVDYKGQALVETWQTFSSVDHAAKFGLTVEPILDPLDKVNSRTGYQYQHASMEADNETPIRSADDSIEASWEYGFSAADVAQYLPELVSNNPGSRALEAIDLERMMVILWEAAKH